MTIMLTDEQQTQIRLWHQPLRGAQKTNPNKNRYDRTGLHRRIFFSLQVMRNGNFRQK
jgi:hypothetical protein